MKTRDLATAEPGCYVVDVVDDLVVNPQPMNALDAADYAARLAKRTRREFAVREVLNVLTGGVVEMCMSTSCSREFSVSLTPQRTIDLPGLVILLAGQEARLCEEHAKEVRDLARLVGVDLVVK